MNRRALFKCLLAPLLLSGNKPKNVRLHHMRQQWCSPIAKPHLPNAAKKGFNVKYVNRTPIKNGQYWWHEVTWCEHRKG